MFEAIQLHKSIETMCGVTMAKIVKHKQGFRVMRVEKNNWKRKKMRRN